MSMPIRLSATIGLIGLALGLGLTPYSTANPAETQASNVDPVHSAVVFRIKHFDVSYFYGRFNRITGHVEFDAEDPTKTSFVIAIKADSVDTNSGQRDRHLKSPDFFNAREFSAITFKSTRVSRRGDNRLDVSGDLTLHGVTRPLSLTVDYEDPKEVRGKSRMGFETTFTIKRSDFGMNSYIAEKALGDEVKLFVGVETVG
ncbi:MAG: YceI family protein [Planctomycetota bacterium]|jgi:polyisoprenoid-binding protein YceI